MRYLKSLSLSVAVLAAGLWLGAPARALPLTHTDVVTPSWSFTGIQESTVAATPADPALLFDQPLGAGDQLVFFPPAFSAQASGAGGFDSTGSQLQLTITPNSPTNAIAAVNITEFGDAVMTDFPPPGTAATGTYANMAGFLTVLEANGLPITPVVIGWTGTFTPTNMLSLPGNFGTTLWNGTVSIDVASQVPNATKVVLSYDNDLYAYSEVGSSAKIQKKVVDGPAVVITVIPEPGTIGMLAIGLAGLGFGVRRN